jgi:hypothetical protein
VDALEGSSGLRLDTGVGVAALKILLCLPFAGKLQMSTKGMALTLASPCPEI